MTADADNNFASENFEFTPDLLEEAKNNLVRAEKMKILNMYSLSHYDKLRRTISIVYF